MVSLKGRYALRIMIDLAEHPSDSYIPMKKIEERQELSLKHLERIVPSLAKSGFVESVHGKGGGYRLTKAPEDHRVGDILRLTEGALAPVACLKCGAKPCSRAEMCKTLPMWNKFCAMVNTCFDGITLADLMQTEIAQNYVI